MKYIYSIAFIMLFTFAASASMICPPTKYISCSDDIDNLNLTGKPTLFGSHKYFIPKYTDQYFTNACNVGHVIRRWYIDLNNNGYCENSEPTCYQDIFLEDQTYNTVTIAYPKDITVSCQADIPYTSPLITNGPCDLIGVSHTDQEFILLGGTEDGCKKILRKFTIINWCNYNPNSTTNQVWTGTQVIKVVDKVKPEIIACKDVTIGFNEGCKSRVTLTNKATDEGNCASVKLYWIVEIDLYADGVRDLYYANSESGDFFLPQKNNNEEIKITLPGLYGNGLHKVIWKVKDSCGNLTSCSSTFTTKDTKPPLAYCPGQVSVGVANDGSKVITGAAMFNFGSTDNCTAPQYIRTSFSSNVADSLRYFDCSNAGFQELNVYFHDIAGNYSYCKVALTVYDNNGCQGNLSIQGKVMSLQGKPMQAGKIQLQANQDLFNLYRDINEGAYNFESTAIYADTKIIPSKQGIEAGLVDLEDYIIFRDYLMSTDTLTPLGYLAGDINDDGRANGRDMVLLKEFIINNSTTYGPNDWKFVACYLDLKKVTLKNYSPVYETRNFNGALDFIAIAKGDFTESLPALPEGRSDDKINMTEGEIATINGEKYVPIYMDRSLQLDAMYLNVTGITKDKIHTNIDCEMVGSSSGTSLFIFDNAAYNADQPLFYINADTYSKDVQFDGYAIEQNVFGKIALTKKPALVTQSIITPNPAQTFITVDAPVNTVVEIYSISGELKAKETLLGYKSKIDISTLQSGVYILKNTNTKEMGKFVKM